jgi:hypothetical protein
MTINVIRFEVPKGDATFAAFSAFPLAEATAAAEEKLRTALATLSIAIGLALVPTSSQAVIVPGPAEVAPGPNVIEVDRRCGPGRVWIRGHRNYRGYWVRGHCVRRR